MANQRLLAIQLAGGALQQLGQMQQIGQRALAIVLLLQPCRQFKVVQQTVQHRQHTLALPDTPVITELVDPLLPQALVLIQLIQRLPVEVQAVAGQRRAQQAVVAGLGTGAQPAQHILRLLGCQHRVLVGQIHAAHAAGGQRITNQLRLATGAHQHRHVCRAHRRKRLVAAGKPGAALLACLQQRGHLAGTALGHLPSVDIASQWLFRFQQPGGQGRRGLTVATPDLAAPACLHRQKRHGVVITLAKQKGASGEVLLGLLEDPIDRRDHRLAGAEVGIQILVPPGGVTTGPKIGVNIRPAEGIDRLLGVADQQQRAVLIVFRYPVDAIEDAVLQRVGILKFVDQRDRKLLTDNLGQPVAIGALQRGVEPGQHVVEAHLRTAALFRLKAHRHPVRRMTQRIAVRIRQRSQRLAQLRQAAQHRVIGHGALLPGLAEAVFAEPGPGRRRQFKLYLFRRQRPLAQGLKPGRVVALLNLALVDHALLDRLIQQRFQLIGPLHTGHLERGQFGITLVEYLLQQRLQFGSRRSGCRVEQPARLCQQRVRLAPTGLHPGQRTAVQVIAMQAPVITRDLGQQVALVGFQRLGKQAAAVKGVLAQHTLTPAVNGRYRGLIHPLGGDIQLARGASVLGFRDIRQQAGENRVRFRQFTTEGLRALYQPCANAVTQFLGRGLGKGHHQHIWRQQFTAEGTVAIAMPQYQPQVKRRDGEGLAGTGTGFNQATATQRAAQGQRALVAHAWSSPAGVIINHSSSIACASG